MNQVEYFDYLKKQDPTTTTTYKNRVGAWLFGDMTYTEAACYLARYPDLKAAFGTDIPAAINHWNTYGKNELRNKGCYEELTDEEAKCYLDHYPDVA